MAHKWSPLARFDITDEAGSVAFQVRGDFDASMTLRDPAGRAVATITADTRTGGFYRVEANSSRARLRRWWGSGGPYQIVSNEGELTASGSGLHLSLARDGSVIASMSRKFSLREKLAVDIADNQDAAFILAIMLTMHATHAPRR